LERSQPVGRRLPPSAEPLSADIRRKVDGDRLRMLYDQAPAAAGVTMVTVIGLVISAAYRDLSLAHGVWTAAILTLLLLRFALYAAYVVNVRRRLDDMAAAAASAHTPPDAALAAANVADPNVFGSNASDPNVFASDGSGAKAFDLSGSGRSLPDRSLLDRSAPDRGIDDADLPEATVAHWRRLYVALVVATGAMFALWPLLFFHEQSEAQRLSGALILGSLAGGSVAVLSVHRGLALCYGALMILSYSAMLIAIGGFEERVCGLLGLMYWLALVLSVNRTHLRVSQSLIYSHRNAALVQRLDGRSRELRDSNQRLAAAQESLRDTNQRLERRILERTAELHRLATRDSLTGLANRSRLGELSAAHMRGGDPPVALYFIDLDGFKEINDSMGHAVGDRVLAEVAKRLDAAAGHNLAISRWGGDEFVILRRAEADPNDERRYAERLLAALRAPVQIDPYTVRVDASVGIAHWPRDGGALQELVYSADLAVYSAKAEGRGTIRIFDEALAEQSRRTLRVRRALARELAGGSKGLSLVYQPIFDAASGELTAVEALMRWRHAQLGPVGPGEFIPLAEQSGEMIALGLWALREACRFAAGFERAQLPAMCVNVSVQQLLYASFAEDLAAVLRETGLPGERLALELTESVFIADFAQIAEVFRRIEPLGVAIAIDDFGTGYSSLSYLQRLPAKVLKLDGSFVRAFDTGGAPIVEAGISLARAFGMRVVAEGVEREEQLKVLLAMRIDRVQGFLLGMPMSGDELKARYIDGRFPPHPLLLRAAGAARAAAGRAG
jgi:diguanylate cyclase (GGDEF)-like protein